MVRRHREILNCIYNTEGFVNGNYLAKMCSVSIRTIQLDIKALNHLLSEYGIKINSVVKKGYYLDDRNKSILKEKNIIRKVIDYKYIKETPVTPFERQMYIILKLTRNEVINFDELENELYMSESTINKDIISAAVWLKDNLHINIKYLLSQKVELKVTEKEKRNIISWVLSYQLNASTLQKQWNYIFEENDFINSCRKINLILESETKRYGYYLSGHSLQLLGIEISIAITRSNMGNKLEEIFEKDKVLKPVILAISHNLEEKMNIRLPQSEWLNIQEYFLSKQFVSGTNIENIITNDTTEVVNDFLAVLKKKYQVDYEEYPMLKDKLLLYVAPMINRLKYSHCIGNRINENVCNIHPIEYEMASEMNEIAKEKINLSVPPIDIAYIALHLVSIYKIWSKKINTIIVCDYDESVISYIKNRIVSQLEERIKLTGCFTFTQFITSKKEELIDVELIITTSTLADQTSLPFVKISPVMDKNELNKLLELLNGMAN